MSCKRSLRLTEIKKIILCSLLVAMMMLSAGFTRVSLPENLHQVIVNADGKTITFDTNRTSPQLLLAKAGVKLSAKDEYEMHKIDEARTEINVYRAVPVTITYEGQKKEVLTSKQTVGDALIESGYNLEFMDVTPGLDTKIRANLDIAVSDSAAKLEALRREREEQVQTSRGMQRYTAVYNMEATAYLPTDGGGDGITASGMVARRGVVAVDTDVIPLGTRLYIPGYGEAIAADTGGAIYGERIDLCMESYGEAMDFGRRDVTVYVLD